MVDLKEYTLVFWRKEDGKRFIARRVCEGQYVLRDPNNPEESIRIRKGKLKKEFVSDKDNSRSPIKKMRLSKAG